MTSQHALSQCFRQCVGLLCLLISLARVTPVIANEQEIVSFHPLYQSFSPKQYDGHNQTWSVDFDSQGRLYSANNNGVLIYDGVDWQILSNFSLGIIRSVVVREDGRLLVGGHNAVGIYTPDSSGNWQYAEMKIPPSLGDIGRIFQGVEHNGNVFFASDKSLIKVSASGTISGIPSDQRVSIGKTRDLYWAYFADKGLFYLDDINGQPIAEPTSSDIVGISKTNDRLLLFLRNGEIRLQNSIDSATSSREFSLITHPELLGSTVIGVSDIPKGSAVSTWQRGLFIIDEKGRLIRHVQEKNYGALGSGYSNGNLWIAFDGAMVRMPWPILMEKVESDVALKNKIESIAEYNDKLYLGSNNGLLQMADGKVSPVAMPQTSGSATPWNLAVTERGLLAVTQDGTYLVNDENIQLIIKGKTRGLLKLHSLKHHYLVTSFTRGTFLLNVTKEATQIVHHDESLTITTTSMAQDSEGTIYIGTRKSGAYALTINDDFSFDVHHYNLEIFNPKAGQDPFSTVFLKNGEARIAIFSNVCEPQLSPSLGCKLDADFAKELNISQVIGEDSQGYIYILSPSQNALISADRNGKYQRDFSNFEELPSTRLNQILDTDKGVWLARRDGLWLFNPKNLFPKVEPNVWVQGVASGQTAIYQAATILKGLPHQVTRQHSSLRFYFASNASTQVSQHQWRTQLIGLEKEYSQWSSEHWKDYSELPGGDYQLLVQLKLRSGRLSEPTLFSFSVEYPWYWTVQARLGYVLLGLLVLLVATHFLTKYRVKSLRARQVELENAVAVRTQQIADQKIKLAEQAEALVLLDQSKSRFFANISHEFRTPLTLILGPLQDALIGRFGELSDDLRSALSLARARSEQLLSLIEEMLDIARLDAGALPLNGQQLDLIALCQQVVNQLSSWAKSKSIRLQVDYSVSSLYIVADSKQLSKVLSNLIGNAIKFTPDAGDVCLSVSQDAAQIFVRVKDSGPGISEQDIRTIFKRFHQVEKHSHDSSGGVGLGLSLALEISQMHGGKIQVDSKLGEGAEFTLILPRVSVLEESPESSVEIVTTAGGIVKTEQLSSITKMSEDKHLASILVVEDDADLAEFIAGHFRENYHVKVCNNGEAGLKQARVILPDLIISDVMMPIMDGMELCRRLKADKETDFIPFILLTARVENSDRIDGFDIGADDYLSKPFDSQVLKSRVENLIASRKKLLERASDNHLNFPKSDNLQNRDHQFVASFNKVLKEGLSDSHFSVEKMAEKMFMERTTLYKKVQTTFQTTPSELIIQTRLKWAQSLLNTDKGNIAEIAFTVGYNSVAHFSQSFKKHVGCTPSQFRERNL